MKYNAQGQEVADDDPTAVSDTPPAPPAPAPFDPTILSAYEQQLQLEARRNAQLTRELDELRRTPAAPPTPEKEKEFFDTPRSTMVEIVREELKNAVGPLNDYVSQSRRDAVISNFKQQMRANPAGYPFIDKVEDVIDKLIANTPNVDANTMTLAYNTAVGHVVSTRGYEALTGSNNPPPPPNPTPSPVPPTPPHIRPTPPAPPRRDDSKPKRVLNENEKKIARFRNQTDDEYIVWTDDVRPSEVAHITDEQIKERIKK